MSLIFADSSFFIGLVDRMDQHHPACVLFLRNNQAPLFTTSAVVMEIGGFFSDVHRRPFFLACLNVIEKSKLEMVHVDPSLQQRGIDLFTQRPDKNWSLADCISFIVLHDRNIHEAASSDRHFDEAGIFAILRHLPKN